MPKTSALVIDDELDAPILKLLAEWQAIADKALAELKTYDTVVKVTPNGHEQKRAHLSVLSEATSTILALSKELGRTPASRVRLGAESGDEPTDEDLDLPPLPKRKGAAKTPAKKAPAKATAAKERPKRAPRAKSS